MMLNLRTRKGHFLRGFSLLEVMVALAILALSFAGLLLVQARATDLAVQARNISIATQLARLQLIECKEKAQKAISSVGDFKLEGDFSEQGHENFTFECHAPKFNMKTPSASKIDEQAKKKAPEDKKGEMQSSASAMSPILTLITDSLGNAVRELVVIVRFGEEQAQDEVRVVTHVIDLSPMSVLDKMLKQGANSFGGDKGRKDKDQAQGQPERAQPNSPGTPGPGGGY
jgi:prepilin-type N-terminal cleavage/methylation domain-containing protein